MASVDSTLLPAPINRESIRTMRKDIKRLREVDATQEREKISNYQVPPQPTSSPTSMTPLAAATPKPMTAPPRPPAPPTPKARVLETALQQGEAMESRAIASAKPYANEQEKEEIFLLESEQKNLQSQLNATTKPADAGLAHEKASLVAARNRWEEKLRPLLEEEKGLAGMEQGTEEIAKQASTPQERQSIAKRQADLESQRQDLERRRLPIDQALKDLAARTANLERSYQGLSQQDQLVTDRVKEIDRRLKTIYASITQREIRKRSTQVQAKATPPKPKVPPKKVPEETLIRQAKEREEQFFKDITSKSPKTSPQTPTPATPVKPVEKVSPKEIPLQAQEQSRPQATIDQTARKKFMEEVEIWANSSH